DVGDRLALASHVAGDGQGSVSVRKHHADVGREAARRARTGNGEQRIAGGGRLEAIERRCRLRDGPARGKSKRYGDGQSKMCVSHGDYSISTSSFAGAISNCATVSGSAELGSAHRPLALATGDGEGETQYRKQRGGGRLVAKAAHATSAASAFELR